MNGFDLMKQGLDVQGAIVKANQDADISRIVSSDETLHAVMLEAISKGAFVWANAELKRTVISKVKPNGEGWVKVHGTYNQYNWLWKYRDTNSIPDGAA